MTKDTISFEEFAKGRVEARNEAHLAPNERAELVNTLMFHALGIDDPSDMITHPLYWDILCYCCEMMNLYASQVGSENMLKAQKYINAEFYSHHYSVPDDHAILGPGKKIHRAIWNARLGIENIPDLTTAPDPQYVLRLEPS
jgi:hypothetical protein